MRRVATLGTAMLVVVLLLGHLAAAGQSGSTSKATTTSPVNINTATADQLDSLPGIGAKMATRIIDYRQKNGGFKKLEDLMNVQGIGEKNFLKLKPYITLTPPKSEKGSSQ
jgi:competence protein ComEA